MTTNDCIILYVEDDEDIAELNIRWFDEQGYEMVYARTGAEAIGVFGKVAPDIVLLDIMLPDTTGFEVCKRMQEIDEDVPVIFLTSLSDSRNAIKGLQSGAYDYIRKDTDLPEIEMRLKAILARTGYNNVVRITDACYVDSRKMTIVVQDKAYKVGGRHIQLLKLLLQRKSHICERDFLTTKIWGDNLINADIYLNQSICTLRRILSADKRLKLKTFRNTGVILEIDR